MHRHRKRASAAWACQGILLLLVTTLLSTLLLWSRGRGLSRPATTSQDVLPKARNIGVHSVLTASQNKTNSNGEAGPEFSLWSSEEETRRWKACYQRRPEWPEPPPQDQSSGYLHVALSGGLNQMRVGLCDAVVVARVLNATLVVPHFDKDSWWDDHSSLEEVFDVDHLIEALQADVRIVKAVPDALATAKVTSKLYPRKSTPQFYVEHALPLLRSKGQLELRKFDFRLADRIDEDLQKLRCRVNFHALRFTPTLETIGRRLVSAVSKDRKPFVALHLRFEPDMLAFSGCDYGLGAEAEAELTALRARWKNLPQDMDPDHQRRHGHCVLTPEERLVPILRLLCLVRREKRPQNASTRTISGCMAAASRVWSRLEGRSKPSVTRATLLCTLLLAPSSEAKSPSNPCEKGSPT
ncbi:O-fucosyltransferase family protein [Klebsormidium nitens]|uniref:O-fucosyltransferase family protein n=1 Tax=Klebsormidium nitens TaxID=105231 RepID=A0A1Y1HU74_KLENI|nr:O-fucosyltransferase family protein [Klebsormidium nitens]|eukprot:GAQ81683.1 O-fucosyltransferase family protein [Klebsormidium nitens]